MEACVFHGNTSVGFGGCEISMETSPAKMAEEQLWLFWAEFSWGKGTNSSSTFLFLRLLISAVRFQAVFLTSCKVRVQKEFQFGRSSSFWVPFLISWRHQYDTRYKDADCIPRIPQQEWWFGTSRAGKPLISGRKRWSSQFINSLEIWNLPAWGVFKTLFAYVCICLHTEFSWSEDGADLAGAGFVRPWKWSFNPRCSTGCNGHDGKTDLPKKTQLPSKPNRCDSPTSLYKLWSKWDEIERMWK